MHLMGIKTNKIARVRGKFSNAEESIDRDEPSWLRNHKNRLQQLFIHEYNEELKRKNASFPPHTLQKLSNFALQKVHLLVVDMCQTVPDQCHSSASILDQTTFLSWNSPIQVGDHNPTSQDPQADTFVPFRGCIRNLRINEKVRINCMCSKNYCAMTMRHIIESFYLSFEYLNFTLKTLIF